MEEFIVKGWEHFLWGELITQDTMRTVFEEIVSQESNASYFQNFTALQTEQW